MLIWSLWTKQILRNWDAKDLTKKNSRNCLNILVLSGLLINWNQGKRLLIDIHNSFSWLWLEFEHEWMFKKNFQNILVGVILKNIHLGFKLASSQKKKVFVVWCVFGSQFLEKINWKTNPFFEYSTKTKLIIIIDIWKMQKSICSYWRIFWLSKGSS